MTRTGSRGIPRLRAGEGDEPILLARQGVAHSALGRAGEQGEFAHAEAVVAIPAPRVELGQRARAPSATVQAACGLWLIPVAVDELGLHARGSDDGAPPSAPPPT